MIENKRSLNVAVLLACMAVGLFTLLDSIVKFALESSGVGLILELFGIIGLSSTWLYCHFRKPKLRIPGSKQALFHAIRSGLLCLATYLLYSSYANYGLTDIALIWLCAPLLAIVAARYYLGEPVPVMQWVALAFGSISLVSIAVVQNYATGYSSLYVIGGAVCYGLALVLGRHLLTTDGVIPVLIAFYITLVAVFCYELPNLARINIDLLLLLLLAAFIQVFAQLLLTIAYRSASVTVVAPLEYTSLLWAVPMGWYFFNESPSALTAAIACVVVAANFLVISTPSRV